MEIPATDWLVQMKKPAPNWLVHCFLFKDGTCSLGVAQDYQLKPGFHDISTRTGISIVRTPTTQAHAGKACAEWITALFFVPYLLDTVKQDGGLSLMLLQQLHVFPNLSTRTRKTSSIFLLVLVLVLVFHSSSLPFCLCLCLCCTENQA